MGMNKFGKYFLLFLIVVSIIKCAKKSTPTGGLKDTLPPLMINASPKMNTVFFDKEKITIEDYLDLSHIHISNRKTGMGHVDMTLYKLGLTRDIYLRAQHFLVAPYIVEQSDMAITTTKGFAVDRNLAWRELPFDIDPLVLHLYWHENNDNESSSKWMRELMLKTYGKLQQVS